MPFPHYFKAANNKFHLKQRVIPLKLLLNSCEYFNFSINPNLGPLVINYHAEDVSQLQNKDILFDEDLACLHEAALKELVVIDQVAGEHELRLEGRPDWVGLLATPLLP
jgi:hypothetical protein